METTKFQLKFLIYVDCISISVLSAGAEPEESRLSRAASDSEQGTPGEPTLPICHLSDRELQDIRKNPREGNFATFVTDLSIDCFLLLLRVSKW
jgi:hypothetical protein